jgi:transcriptional regulator with XRE-family HTH domain
MSARAPNSIDKSVGTRVRMLRIQKGMSQERLAEELGVTFQQLQKYEKGVNRISAGLLHRLTLVFKCSVEVFFADVPGNGGSEATSLPEHVSALLATTEGLRLVKAFVAIKDRAMRRSIVNLVDGVGT